MARPLAVAFLLDTVGVSLTLSLPRKKEALIEMSQADLALADTMVNEVSTHEWSMTAKKMPSPDGPQEEPKVEAWYINRGSRKDRSRCMEAQLVDAGFAPLRFSALELPQCSGSAGEQEKCYKESGFKASTGEDFRDCVANGIEEMPQLSAPERSTVIANWCNHKRLFKALLEAPTSATYFLVLEDTPVVSTHSMKKVIDDFIQTYKHLDWSFLQLDPYGGIAQPVSFHKGRPVFRAADDMENFQSYQGSHSLLLKQHALPQLVHLMSKRKATRMEDIIMQLPQFLSISAGITMNPMVNRLREKVELPASCVPEKQTHSSLIQSDGVVTQDNLWSLWPRKGTQSNFDQVAWWVPQARQWISLAHIDRSGSSDGDAAQTSTVTELKSSEEQMYRSGVRTGGSNMMAAMGKGQKSMPFVFHKPVKNVQVFQVGSKDEDPSRAKCFHDHLMAQGILDAKRHELLQLPQDCSHIVHGVEYEDCLARKGFSDCSFVGQFSLDDFKGAEWDKRVKVRDHVVTGTCSFKRLLEKIPIKGKSPLPPYVVILNENAVLDDSAASNILNFLEQHPKAVNGKEWRAIQVDPYGREAPISQGLGKKIWSPEKVSKDDAKDRDIKYLKEEAMPSRFWGMHAVMLKRDAIPSILREMMMEDKSAIGPVDRIPRHSKGWLAANLGVAYDPHMAALVQLDGCSPSRSQHFRIARADIPDSWSTQSATRSSAAQYLE